MKKIKSFIIIIFFFAINSCSIADDGRDTVDEL